MGSNNSKNDDGNNIKEAEKLLASATATFEKCKGKSQLEQCALAIESIMDMDVHVSKHFENSKEWLKSRKAELRSDLADIIREYGGVLDATLDLSKDIQLLCRKWMVEFDLMNDAKEKIKGNDDHGAEKILKSLDIGVLQESIKPEDLESLLKRYQALNLKIENNISILNKDIKDARKKFWICFGIGAASLLLLAGCVTLIILSCGGAVPAIAVAGAEAAATAAATATASFSAVGLGVGISGAITAATTLITATTIAADLHGMQVDLQTTQDTLLSMKTHIVSTGSSIQEIRRLLISENGNTSIMIKGGAIFLERFKNICKDTNDVLVTILQHIKELQTKTIALDSSINVNRNMYIFCRKHLLRTTMI